MGHGRRAAPRIASGWPAGPCGALPARPGIGLAADGGQDGQQQTPDPYRSGYRTLSEWTRRRCADTRSDTAAQFCQARWTAGQRGRVLAVRAAQPTIGTGPRGCQAATLRPRRRPRPRPCRTVWCPRQPPGWLPGHCRAWTAGHCGHRRPDTAPPSASSSSRSPSWLMSSTTPLGDQEVGQLAQAPGRKRQVVVLRAAERQPLDLLALGEGERRRPTASVTRVQRVEPVGVEVVDDIADPVLVKVTSAIRGAGMPWAASRIMWARRQVTTEPLLRCTMRSSRLPS
jgi:hypothetical protein